jgi:hypothetical protein
VPQCGTEGVTIVIDQFAQPSDQRFGLLVCQLKVHGPNMGALTDIPQPGVRCPASASFRPSFG